MADGGVNLSFTDDGIAIVTMCDGENKFNPDMVQRWHEVLDIVERKADLRGLITSGKDKFFSTGMDVDWLKKSSPDILDRYHDNLHRLYTRLLNLGVTTAAVINDLSGFKRKLKEERGQRSGIYTINHHLAQETNGKVAISQLDITNESQDVSPLPAGHAVAEGAFIALMHDFRIMRNDRGWITWPEVHLRLPMTDVMLDLIRAKVPRGVVQREAFVFGKRFDGKTAQSLGLVDKLASAENLLQEARNAIQSALGKSQVSTEFLKSVKEDIYLEQSYEEQKYKSSL